MIIGIICKGYEAKCPVCKDEFEADYKNDIECALENHMRKEHPDIEFEIDVVDE